MRVWNKIKNIIFFDMNIQKLKKRLNVKIIMRFYVTLKKTESHLFAVVLVDFAGKNQRESESV